jgi:hypothetical protein
MTEVPRRRWWRLAGLGLLIVIGVGSILFYVAVAATINGQASVSPFPGWVAVLQRVPFQVGDRLSLTVVPVIPGGPGAHPKLSYVVTVCGTRPFEGVLLLGGAARLTGVSTSPSPAEASLFPPGGTPAPRVVEMPDLVVYNASREVFDLGRVQVVYLTLDHRFPCLTPTGKIPLGEFQGVSGFALAPVQRYWAGPWWNGPHSSEVWPEVGAFPGPEITDLGTFGFRGLEGLWVRSSAEKIEVRAGGLTTRASIDIARPALADSSGLDWSSNDPINPGPQARVTNTDDLTG